MVEYVEELVLRPRAGAGLGFNKDDSDELADMGYAEKLVLEPNFLKLLTKLKIVSEETIEEGGKKKKKLLGGAINVSKDDLVAVPVESKALAFNPETGLAGAANQINKVFVAIESPFYASTYITDDAKKITKVRTKGEHAGEPYEVKEPDRIRIHRISDKFDINKYAAEGSVKTAPVESGGEGSGLHQEPTSGVRNRVGRWIEEKGDDVFDDLKAIACGIITTGNGNGKSTA